MTSLERVLLVRHGQTDWNVDGRWQGSLPIALNAVGFVQAKALGKDLAGRPIGAIYSSDLPRALQTAQEIGAVFNLTPQLDAQWREFNLGIFQGNTRSQIMEQFPQEWAAFQQDYWDYAVPHGESRRAFQARVYAGLEAVVASANAQEVVVVSHGGAIKMLLLKLFPDTPELRDFRIENTSVTIIEREGQGWRLVTLADNSHLGEVAAD